VVESVTFGELVHAFREVGLEPGDTVNVHSRLFSIGRLLDVAVRDIPATYVNAIREVIGETGTIVVPTYTTSFGRFGTPFILEESPSEMGVFSEQVRRTPGSIRSLHPVQSLTALGGQAQALAANHPRWNVGHDTIWDRMLQCGGKALTIGIPLHRALSFAHQIEFLACVPYLYHKILDGEVYAGGERIQDPFLMAVRYLQYDIVYDLRRLEASLHEKSAIKQVPLGGGAIWLVRLADAFQISMEGLQRDPYYLLQNAPSFLRGKMPLDGTTINRELTSPRYFLA